jgi:hypothetical protein
MSRTATQRVLFFVRWQLYPVILAVPAHVAFVLRGRNGRARCRPATRAKLASQAGMIHLRVECGHNPEEVLHVMEAIVELPPNIQGVIVECGAYRGGSTAKLSLAAAVAGRRVIVCDSFEGLPQVTAGDHTDAKPDFATGEYAGRLDDVRANVRRFGDVSRVEFVPGWYNDTLGQLHDTPIACGFWDVDLQESFRCCLQALWPQVQPGARVFMHDVDRDPVVDVFRDDEWWGETLGTTPPDLVGAHHGLSARSPLIGFVVK